MSKHTETLTTATPAPPINPRMAGEERRLQIVRVAMTLFSQRGFRGTTTKEIAQAAGVSEAIIFRHFATKEELYTAILDHKACAGCMADPRDVVASAIKHKDDRAVFEGLAVEMMRHYEQDMEFWRLLTHAALEGHQLAEMFWERNVRMMYEFLGAYIMERQRDGAFRDVDPPIIVRAFAGMIIHHALNNHLWDKSRRLLDITNERAAREFTAILLKGIATTTGQASPRAGTRKRRGAAPRVNNKSITSKKN